MRSVMLAACAITTLLPSAAAAATAQDPPCSRDTRDGDACCGCSSCPRACERVPLERTSVFGVRLSMTDVRGGDHPDRTASVALGGASEQYGGGSGSVFTVHASSFFVLGGGGSGFEGGLGIFVSGGARAPVGENHGPFARIGVGGELFGNDELYFSRFELPLGEIGWQYLEGRTVLEAGARIAPILTGRYNAGDDVVRRLNGAWDWGGYLAAHAWFGRVDLQLLRIEVPRGSIDTPIYMARATACTYPWPAVHVGLCVDGAYFDGEGGYGPIHELRDDVKSTYGGVTIGAAGF